MGTIAAIACLVVASIIIFITCYNYECEIKILLFEKFNWHPFDKQECEENKEHDVYLMYSHEDEFWVMNTLLEGLEKSGYRTFVPDRDFTVGASTADEMSNAFSKTRRVLVVISQKFINNRNAMSDFYHAYEHDRSSTGKRFLVLIKLKEKINFGERHKIFQRYLNTNYFVPIQARYFWSRLHYWLPPPNNKQLPASTDNTEIDDEVFTSEDISIPLIV